jgi:hypothetical protein
MVPAPEAAFCTASYGPTIRRPYRVPLGRGRILADCGKAVKLLPWPRALGPHLPPDPPALGSRRVDGDSLSCNLASQVVGLVPHGIEDSFGKRATIGCAARRQGKRFDEEDSADQRSCCGVVIQGKMVDLVSGAPGFLPYAQAEILLRRRTCAGIQNFGLIAVKLVVSEVELGSVRDGWIVGGVALGNKLKTPHSNDRWAGRTRCAAQVASQTRQCSQRQGILRIRQDLPNYQGSRRFCQSTRACRRDQQHPNNRCAQSCSYRSMCHFHDASSFSRKRPLLIFICSFLLESCRGNISPGTPCEKRARKP